MKTILATFRSTFGALCLAGAVSQAFCFVPVATAAPAYRVTTRVKIYAAFATTPSPSVVYCNNGAAAAGIFCSSSTGTVGGANEHTEGPNCPATHIDFGVTDGNYGTCGPANWGSDATVEVQDNAGVGSPLSYAPIIDLLAQTDFGNPEGGYSLITSYASATGGMSVADAGANLSFVTSVDVTLTELLAAKQRTGTGARVARQKIVAIRNGVVVAAQDAFVNNLGLSGEGVSGGVGGEYVVSLPVLGAIQDGSIKVAIGTVDDGNLDLNGDGVFDEDDVQWIRDNFVEIPDEEFPFIPGNFVFTENHIDEAIDEADAVFLESILELFGPGPKFGDFNRDGVIDCRDSYGSSVYFGVTIGDPDYRYELDSDRNGIVDQDDKDAFFALVNHCDFNQDEFVDDADFIIFYAAYNIADCEDVSMPANCPADLNLDGIVDDADFSIFVVRYNEGSC